MVTSFILLLSADGPDVCTSAPCIHNLTSSPLTHTLCLCKCLRGHSLNLAKDLIQLKKNTGGKKKKENTIFFSAGSVPCLGSLPGCENRGAGRALGVSWGQQRGKQEGMSEQWLVVNEKGLAKTSLWLGVIRVDQPWGTRNDDIADDCGSNSTCQTTSDSNTSLQWGPCSWLLTFVNLWAKLPSEKLLSFTGSKGRIKSSSTTEVTVSSQNSIFWILYWRQEQNQARRTCFPCYFPATRV